LSLIVRNADSTKIFLINEYNERMTSLLRLVQQGGEDNFNIRFLNEPNNIGSNLSNLIVLTSRNTASTSEALINGLRSYMNVYLIGDTTYGENYGSLSVADPPGNTTWKFQPIVLKTFNSQHQSDYSKGFSPYEYIIDFGITLYPLGSDSEILLQAAINKILSSKGATVESKKSTDYGLGLFNYRPKIKNLPGVEMKKLKKSF
jgi:carboxyl-terminal processing protease